MIGFYAHHHGTGHLFRCQAIAAEIPEETAILSSHPRADIGLPLDAPAEERGADVTAGGALHWVPRDHPGLCARMAALAAWVADAQPRAVHVDVSVEVAVFLRLLGVPVTTLAMPGVRDDAAHRLGYQVCESIIAAWPDWVRLPDHLRTQAGKVAAVGGISRFAGRRPATDPHGPVILLGRGGADAPAGYWQQVQHHLGPGCRLLGPASWREDPYADLTGASVIISAGGQNAIADIACTGRPAIIVPQQRPYDEQAATAAVLAEAGLAEVITHLPAPEVWPEIVSAAGSRQPEWSRWQTEGAARRAAREILAVADRSRAAHHPPVEGAQ